MSLPSRMVSGGKGNTTGFEVHPHQLLPSVFEAPPEEYVIALHDYQPPSQSTIPPSTPSMGGTGKRNSTQTAHVCLAFLAGDRIRVLNRDVSGWWDGELMVLDEYLAEGDSEEDGGIGEEDQGDFRKVKVLRGWFPSNFVEDAGERIGMREVTYPDENGSDYLQYPPKPSSSISHTSTSYPHAASNNNHLISHHASSSSSAGSYASSNYVSTNFPRRTSEVTSELSYRSHQSQASIANSSNPTSSGPVGSTRRGGAGLQRPTLAASAFGQGMQQQMQQQQIQKQGIRGGVAAPEFGRSQSSMGHHRDNQSGQGHAILMGDNGRSHSSTGWHSQDRGGFSGGKEDGYTRGGGMLEDASGHGRGLNGSYDQGDSAGMQRIQGGHRTMDSQGGRGGGGSSQGSYPFTGGFAPDRSFSTDTTSSSSTVGGLSEEQDVETVLEPILQAIALVKAAVISRRHAHFQPSTACVISSIRSLLAATNCLSRDSPLLGTFPALGKIRKTILANLAELVALARSASTQAEFNNGRSASSPDVEEDEMREMEMEGMLKASEETLGNVREFLKMVVQCGESLPERRNGEYPLVPSSGQHVAGVGSVNGSTGSSVIARPGGGAGEAKPGMSGAGRPILESRSITSNISSGARKMDFPSNGQDTRREDADPASGVAAAKRDRKSSMAAKSMGDLRLARKRQEQAINDQSDTPDVPTLSSNESIRSRSEKRRDQQSVSSVSSVGSSHDSSSDSGAGPLTPSTSLGHAFVVGSATSVEVLSGVRQTEDQLLSVIAALIGHAHSHTTGSHPSSLAQLIDLTRETVDRVKELLTIVEVVLASYAAKSPVPKEVIALDQAQTTMYETSGHLVENVERIASTSTAADRDEDGVKAGVIQSATATLRIGATCISLVKAVASRPDYGPFDPSHGKDLKDSRKHTSSRGAPGTILNRRSKAVGHRGEHTLSALGRKASNLESLHLKYERDGFLNPSSDEDQPGSAAPSLDEEEEEEEIMARDVDEEDLTMQPGSSRPRRPSMRSNMTSPLLPNSTSPVMGETPVAPSRRSRANSMSSPMTPRLIQHRSPSRSADLNLLGGDLSFVKTPRQGDETFSRRPSIAESARSDKIAATPKPIPWNSTSEQARLRQPSNNLEVPGLQTFVMPLKPDSEEMVAEVGGPTASDMRMWLVGHDYSPKEISFNPDGQIIGATLEVLVEKMTPQDTLVDPTFWETFFLTFRLFTTPSRLLEALELRYDLAPPGRMPLSPATIKIWNERKVMPVRLRIFNFLKNWLEVHWSPESDREIVPALELFLEERLTNALPLETPRLREILSRQIGEPKDAKTEQLIGLAAQVRNRHKYQSGSPTSPLYANNFFNAGAPTALPPTPIMGKQLFNSLRSGSASISITDFHALELARQLTLMESRLFAAVSLEDLLKTAKKRPESLTAMSTLSNRITGWVADNILNEQDAKKRTALLKFFIKLADRCLGLSNFSSMFAILAGLNSSTILRLKRTWHGLSTKYRLLMDQLRTLIEHTRNHNNYRSRLRSVEPPALPFLGLILTDITFTSDGNPNTRPSTLDPDLKLINFDKYTKLARIAMDFQRYQTPFNLAVLPDCQHWLERVLAEKGSSSIDALYRKSLVLEPRQGSESIPSSTFDKPGWLQGRI